MEHSTSAVNWQPVNVAKEPQETLRDSLAHVAHGADAVCFFQWRASLAGAEKFHSAMVPHAGADSSLFRTVTELGERLRRLAPVVGSRRRPARTAILFDWDCWWASELDSHPSSLVRYHAEALDWYGALLDLGVRADVVPADSDLGGYALVVAPVLYVVPEHRAHALAAYVERGGHLVTTYFSGIVDEHDHVLPGGYPGALRDLLGIRIEEFAPLPAGAGADLDNATTGTIWTDRIERVEPDVEVIARYRTGPVAGRPAITRRAMGGGSAAHVSTRLGVEGLRPVLSGLLAAAGVDSELPEAVRGRVELAVRADDAEEFAFLINRTADAVLVEGVAGEPLLGERSGDAVALGPREVAVLRRPLDHGEGGGARDGGSRAGGSA
jgi:beta-galactosidase